MITNIETIFKILADKNRMRIIKLLEHKKLCVCELAFVLGIKQPSVSRHLKKLKSVGLIEEEQDSFWTNYVLSIKENKQAGIFVGQLCACLKGDAQVKQDLIRLRQANRNTLCCK